MNQSMEQMLLTALQNATNQNVEVMKRAEKNLELFEKEPNFYTALINVFLNRELDPAARYMAILTVKNGIEKSWRKTQAVPIKPDEKALIKNRLLESFNEVNDQIAVQLAVVISKIARLDCPDDWTELMPILLQRVNSQDELEQKRSLQILVQVVKALSSRRLYHDRLMFENFTSNLYDYIVNLWNSFTGLYFQNIQANASLPTCASNLEKSMLSLKILQKLTIYGFQKPAEAAKPVEFLKMIFDRIKDLLECRMLIKTSSTYSPLLEKHEKFTLKHLKILTEFQDYHRSVFTDFAPQVLEMAFNYAFFEGTRFLFDGNELSMPNFVIHCLNLIKGYLLNSSGNVYSAPVEVDEKLTEILKNFFTNERLSYIVEKLLMHYFLLTPNDIEQWENDSETFVGDEGGDSWKYNLRSCTEAFYLSLFHKYNSILSQHLLVYVQKSQALQLNENSSAQDILIKESIYNAVGLVAFHLFDDVDFDNWFTSQLYFELKLRETNFKVLRRRIIWMLGQWSGVKFSKSLRPMLYESCMELLQPTEDTVVRLTASKTLKTVLEDFDFDAEQFLEYLEPSFNLLFHLLKGAKECDTKMNVLYVMSFIIEKMSMTMKIQADNLVVYLPMLWEEGEGHNMLRIAIISSLLQIIKAIEELPQSIAPFIYQVVSVSTNVNDPLTVYLMDEGLELWLIVVQYSPHPCDALLKLCENILPIMEKSTMNLKTCLYIIQAYILLCPEFYLQTYGKNLMEHCQYLMRDIRTEGIVAICKLFLTMLKVMPSYAIELLHSIMNDVVKNLLNDSDYLSAKQSYLQVMTRYFIANQMAFSLILEEVRVENCFQKILSIWLNTMPNITQNEDKKLMALGLCSLLTIPNENIFENFSTIIINVYETLCDIMTQETPEADETDSLILTDATDMEGMCDFDEGYEYKTPHYDRYKSMCLKDPVHSIVLKEYLQSQLVALKTAVGDERYVTLIKTVDPTIHKLLYNYINTFVPVV